MSDAAMMGGCLCGAVRYQVRGPAVFTGVCHCTLCQRATGSAFSMVMGVPETALTVEGTTTRYDGTGGSGKRSTRQFCPTCGSPITSQVELMPGIVMVEVGTLDRPGDVTIGAHIFCRSKLACVSVPEGMATFEAMPPMG